MESEVHGPKLNHTSVKPLVSYKEQLGVVHTLCMSRKLHKLVIICLAFMRNSQVQWIQPQWAQQGMSDCCSDYQ